MSVRVPDVRSGSFAPDSPDAARPNDFRRAPKSGRSVAMGHEQTRAPSADS
jgi:hypothetical protein